MTDSRKFLMLVAMLFILAGTGFSKENRTEVHIPDIPGYLTLKCDFHTHTVFSDGDVWPTLRVEEAWCEGLDAISITDHIEYQPHKDDIPTKHNRPYEIAKSRAEEVGIILIRGAEITREMPPGHLNAIFLQDVEPLATKDWREAIKAANQQGAFVFWNHPGWRQPDEIPIWYDEHTELLKQGLFQGMEVVNWYSHYTKVQGWAIEKNLTLLGNSDIHGSMNMAFDFHKGEHRPMTLVFAKERTAESIKEALFARRTAVYFENLLIGQAEFLNAIFDKSVKIKNPEVSLQDRSGVYIQIYNHSQVGFQLVASVEPADVSIPKEITLEPGKVVGLRLKKKKDVQPGVREIVLPYTVSNLLIGEETGLPVELQVRVAF